MDTAVEDTEVEDRPGSNAPNLLPGSSCLPNPVWVVFGTPAGWCHRFVAGFLLAFNY